MVSCTVDQDRIGDADLPAWAPSAVSVVDAPVRLHWPALDGLRGSAILAVLVCHYATLLPRTPATGVLEIGWAGVDLFFVLSGFLITGILFDDKGKPHYFRDFYARRALRIFPLYYGVLVVTLIVAGIVSVISSGAQDQKLAHLWAAQPSLWTYTANYWMAAQPLAAFSPWSEAFVAMWSLSVEEQFYLVWPVIVSRLSRRGLARVCVGVIAGALALRLALTAAGVHFFWLYVSTPTRADALAAGALLALLIRRPDGRRLARRICAWGGPASLVMVIVLSRGFDPIHHPWLRALLYSALAGLFAALLFWSIDAASLRGIPARFYSIGALRAAGRYSYGLYVLHLPILYLTLPAAKRAGLFDIMVPTWSGAGGMIAANVILCAAAAVASFHLYETPFLNLKRRLT